jgi:methionyl-tRNA synthetase
LREIPFGQDGNFSYDALIERYNADLANGIGNLASRTLAMIQQYFDSVVPASEGNRAISEAAVETTISVIAAFNAFDFTRGIEAVLAFVSQIDKFIVEHAPWKLAKARVQDESAAERLAMVLYTAAESLRFICIWLYPVLPFSTVKIWEQLGMKSHLDETRHEALSWGGVPAGQAIQNPEAVFPRVDAKIAIPKMQELEIIEKQRQDELLGKKTEAAKETAEPDGLISIEDFAKVDLRVGEVKSAEKVKGSDKLLHLKVDIGEAEPRTIVAGIALAYKPEQLIGRKVIIVANLQPRKLRNITSQGMIVAASLEGGLPVLAGFHEEIQPGARLK